MPSDTGAGFISRRFKAVTCIDNYIKLRTRFYPAKSITPDTQSMPTHVNGSTEKPILLMTATAATGYSNI
jgi:hypothetical protein